MSSSGQSSPEHPTRRAAASVAAGGSDDRGWSVAPDTVELGRLDAEAARLVAEALLALARDRRFVRADPSVCPLGSR